MRCRIAGMRFRNLRIAWSVFWGAACILLNCVVSHVRADGLIFSLPADGTWAELSGTTESNYKMPLPPEALARMDEAGKARMRSYLGPQRILNTVRVSSVGIHQYAGIPCRWIELRRSVKFVGSETKPEHKNPIAILKILVRDKELTRGHDPLENAYLAFFNPKEVDVKHVPSDPGFDRVRYEIERFLPCFPPPLRNEKKVAKETIATPIGTFRDCDVISGTAEFDRPLLGGGRWESKATWTIAIHPDAPFGVVRLTSEDSTAETPATGNGLRGTSTLTLTIVAKGDDAVSELKDAKQKQSSQP